MTPTPNTTKEIKKILKDLNDQIIKISNLAVDSLQTLQSLHDSAKSIKIIDVDNIREFSCFVPDIFGSDQERTTTDETETPALPKPARKKQKTNGISDPIDTPKIPEPESDSEPDQRV